MSTVILKGKKKEEGEKELIILIELHNQVNRTFYFLQFQHVIRTSGCYEGEDKVVDECEDDGEDEREGKDEGEDKCEGVDKGKVEGDEE